MVSLISSALVFAGALILVSALAPVRGLIENLPPGPLRNRWYLMCALVVLFISGYLAYAVLFWDSHSALIDLIVPIIFFFGACFVLLTMKLSLQTAVDIMRISHLEREAITDPLTGAYNRRLLDRRLSQEVASAQRYGSTLSVMMLDADHFKKFNDRLGHQAGDEVLNILAYLVSKELREVDVLARYGGEEFFVIAPHTGLLNATRLAERIRKCVESHDFNLQSVAGGAPGVKVSVSIGVASTEDVIADQDALVHAADANLLLAKKSGRNCVVAGAREPAGMAVS